MTESRPETAAERRLERDTAELEHRIHHLEDDLDDAKRKAELRRRDADPAEAVAGDASELGPGSGFGQDPAGADDDPDRDARGGG